MRDKAIECIHHLRTSGCDVDVLSTPKIEKYEDCLTQHQKMQMQEISRQYFSATKPQIKRLNGMNTFSVIQTRITENITLGCYIKGKNPLRFARDPKNQIVANMD